MICSICGAQLPDGQDYCSFCGAQLNNQQPQYNQQVQYNQQPQYNPQQQYIQQPQYNQQVQYNQQYQNNIQPQGIQFNNTAVPGLGMGWFYFIIYAQLFINALSNLGQGISALLGNHYDGSADLVYSMLPSMKVIDTIMGIACILLAVGAIYTRFRLAKYRKNGPLMYYCVIGANVILSIIYILSVHAALSNNFYSISLSDLLSAKYIYSIVISIILLIANFIYFGKRKHLFVN